MGKWGIVSLILMTLPAACSKGQPDDGQEQFAPVSLADRASIELENAPDQLLTRYINDKYGFTIAVPSGWGEMRANVTVDGCDFPNKALDSVLRLSAVDTGDLNEAARQLPGGTMIGENEYRGAMTQADGQRAEFRILKTPRGLITARFHYPVGRIALAAIAKATLDSLTVAGAP